MTPLFTIIILTLLAGLAMPLGASIASIKIFSTAWIENEYRHGVIAFGGGALLSAVALVLVPEGIEKLSVISSTIFLCSVASFSWLLILF